MCRATLSYENQDSQPKRGTQGVDLDIRQTPLPTGHGQLVKFIRRRIRHGREPGHADGPTQGRAVNQTNSRNQQRQNRILRGMGDLAKDEIPNRRQFALKIWHG